MADELNQARKKLFEKLGESTKIYCQLMKQWFSMKTTKEEFDLEARKIMNIEQTRLHNEFLLCLFNKCSNLTSDSGKNRVNGKKPKLSKSKRTPDKGPFQPADPVHYLPQLEAPPQEIQEEASRYCVQEFFLPDQSFIMGRLMLGAWELGMDGADDAAAECLVMAVQFFLKNLLTAILTQRSGYKLREGNVIHSVGRPVPNPWLRNSRISETLDHRLVDADSDEESAAPRPFKSVTELEQQEAFEVACATTAMNPPPKAPISSYDVLLALTVHKSTIPAHSIYAHNMERIICSLNHQTWEDLEAAKHLKS